MENSKRNYGIDFLRIFLMFLIIIGHLYAHSKIRDNLEVFTFKWMFVWASQALTVCAVNCFILITGYFSWNRELSIIRIIPLWKKAVLYSLMLFLINLIYKFVPITNALVADSLLPVLRKQYWFITYYFVLCFMIPFLNVAIQKIQKLKVMIFSIICLFYIFPIFSVAIPEIDIEEGYSVIGFITLYLIGAYFGRVGFKTTKKNALILLVINNIIVFLSKCILTVIVERNDLTFGTALLYHYNTFFQLLNAILLLRLFYDVKFSAKANRFVAATSKHVFPIYLIHEHQITRSLLWSSGILGILKATNNLSFIAIILGGSIGIFLIGLIIDVFIDVVFSWVDKLPLFICLHTYFDNKRFELCRKDKEE